MKPRHITICAVALALGILTALAVARTANAWDAPPLPAGFSIYWHGLDSSNATCPEFYRVRDDNTAPATISGNLCTSADLQAWVAAAPQAATTTTTTPATTTTTAAPATTTTLTPTATTTSTATPAPPTPTVTTTTTATPPYAEYTATLGSAAYSVAFADASTAGSAPITTHTWQFGDGQAATGPNPTHYYVGPGTYTVTEIVVDANGLTSIAVHDLSLSSTTATLGPRQTQALKPSPAKPKGKKPITKHHAKKKANKLMIGILSQLMGLPQ